MGQLEMAGLLDSLQHQDTTFGCFLVLEEPSCLELPTRPSYASTMSIAPFGYVGL